MTTGQVVEAAGAGSVNVYGAAGAYAALLVSRLAKGGPVLCICPNDQRARALADDLSLFLSEPALFVPGHAVSPYAELSPDREALSQRMAALHRLSHRDTAVTCLSAESLTRRVVPPDALRTLATTITVGRELDREAFIELLAAAGYLRTSAIIDPGSFAVRGGVIDIFPGGQPFPVRIELFGDEVESIRTFDPDSQRTLRALDEVAVHPVRETVATGNVDVTARILQAADRSHQPSSETRRLLEAVSSGDSFVGMEILTPAFHDGLVPLWDYISDRATWLVVDPGGVEQAVIDQWELADQRYRDRMDDHRIAFPPADHYIAESELSAAVTTRTRVALCRLEQKDDPTPGVRVSVSDLSGLRSGLERARRESAGDVAKPLSEHITRWLGRGLRVILAVASQTRGDRLRGILGNYDLQPTTVERPDDAGPGELAILRGTLSSGFVSESDGLAVVSEADIFGQARGASARQRRAAKRARDALAGGSADFSSLVIGDFLVHELHGVGRYQGLTKLPVGDTPIDFLNVEYRGGTLYLPVYRMGEIQRYVGAEGHTPKLDKLGGQSFARSRAKVAEKVQALAEELLQLYAQRAALPGFAYPEGDAMYEDFAAAFEFEETPDQAQAIGDVISDMENDKPMDRLVCGDVGYGKTEVALRAILKASLGGKQVAMLAPTTILVEQHYATMLRRFEGWPLNVGKLSRFQKKKQQTEVVLGLASGSVDVVVGTHRLLSKDVRFKDLGLIVVDEEQRFGVAHKERLKKMRSQVDVLTLTATPIPRTLHLAMSGMRDLSIIATPPADRRSIRTFVARPQDTVLKEGVERELSRGGQVFFVTPRIGARGNADQRSIDEWAEHLGELVRGARVIVAHGQMRADRLERAMIDFVDGKYDILVSTTIVESGLDIPRANTMFIADADRFGLSQLYQLRGRIGRSKERAFCYLLVPPPPR